MPVLPGTPFSKDLAVLLGIEQSEFDDGRGNYHELDKFNGLVQAMDLLHREQEEQQDIILSRYAAFYLPATVERVINRPPHSIPNASQELIEDTVLLNAHVSMLIIIQHLPYFMHYFRSSKPAAAPGKCVAGILAERIVSLGPRWDVSMIRADDNAQSSSRPSGVQRIGQYEVDYKHELANIIQVLASICTIFIKEPQDKVIPRGTREQLLPFLKKWGRRYYRDNDADFLGVVSRRLHNILADPTFKSDVKTVRNSMKNWDVCALPTCNATQNLKACGRCVTVRYCSAAHQREHWTYAKGLVIVTHKQMCHKTEY